MDLPQDLKKTLWQAKPMVQKKSFHENNCQRYGAYQLLKQSYFPVESVR